MWAVLVVVGNVLLGWGVPGPMGAFFKLTAGKMLLVIIVAVGAVAYRERKKPKRAR